VETETLNSSGSDGAILIALEKALRERGSDLDFRAARLDFRAARNALGEYLWRKVGREPDGSIPEAIDVLACLYFTLQQNPGKNPGGPCLSGRRIEN
jgi:hypothetical protein